MPHAYIRHIAQAAKAAFYQIAQADSAAKNAALLRLVDLIQANEAALFTANQQDLANGKQKGLSEAMLDRLTINEGSLKTMIPSYGQTLADQPELLARVNSEIEQALFAKPFAQPNE